MPCVSLLYRRGTEACVGSSVDVEEVLKRAIFSPRLKRDKPACWNFLYVPYEYSFFIVCDFDRVLLSLSVLADCIVPKMYKFPQFLDLPWSFCGSISEEAFARSPSTSPSLFWSSGTWTGVFFSTLSRMMIFSRFTSSEKHTVSSVMLSQVVPRPFSFHPGRPPRRAVLKCRRFTPSPVPTIQHSLHACPLIFCLNGSALSGSPYTGYSPD